MSLWSVAERIYELAHETFGINIPLSTVERRRKQNIYDLLEEDYNATREMKENGKERTLRED